MVVANAGRSKRNVISTVTPKGHLGWMTFSRYLNAKTVFSFVNRFAHSRVSRVLPILGNLWMHDSKAEKK